MYSGTVIEGMFGMLETLKALSVFGTALGLGVTGYIQLEKFRLDGEWLIDTCTETADFSAYQDLHLAWRVFLSDDPLGAPVVGDGEKSMEAFAQIPPKARWPVRFVGTKETNRVTLTARFEGARRSSTGRFELAPTVSPRKWSGYLPFWQKNVDVLEGTFALTAGNARGRARAIRLINGQPKAENVQPFECGGISEPRPPEPASGPEDTPEVELLPEADTHDTTNP